MRIAVLSGKGGAGKTFVAVNLAFTQNATYIDCDVEEPNGKIFLKPTLKREEIVSVMVPIHNKELCNGCKKCVEFCQFNALAFVNEKLLVFPEICHSCDGCVLICPNVAISRGSRNIGTIEVGRAGDVEALTGIVNIGEATGVPIIKKLLENLPTDKTVIIDCPPGSACTVMESIKESNYCVLVTEPTAFGVHNLSMVYELVKLFNKPHGVIINKDVQGETIAEDFCKANKINVLAKIPYSKDLGLINSKGLIASENAGYRNMFNKIFERIQNGGAL